jgi:TatA/E family protein of Tat protein translocase
MFGMGMPEVILILAVGLIVIGPKKLPELAKSLGKGIVEFKRATQEFRDTIDVKDEVSDFRDTVDTIKTDIKEQLTDKPKQTKEHQEKDTDKSDSNVSTKPINVSETQEVNSHGK